MPRSRPASNPLSYHKPTGQHYVTRGGRRVYLGADRDEALAKYHRLALGMPCSQPEPRTLAWAMTAKELVNRFLAAQEANWRNAPASLGGYRSWLARFLADHPGLIAADFSVEMFAAWKLSLKRRDYAPKSINHYLSAVRAVFAFGEEVGLLEHMPRLRRVKNEPAWVVRNENQPLYTPDDVAKLRAEADSSLQLMILLALNCGFGPKDLMDLKWSDFCTPHVTLRRSKTGIGQTFLLWPETIAAFAQLRNDRLARITRLRRRGRERSDGGYVFTTKYWRQWNKDAVAEQFRKLCRRAQVECHGFYRLRHCASTAMSLVAMPHIHRKFMRHAQLQQQVTYTHVPDEAVDAAILRAREALLGSAKVTADPESNRGPAAGAASDGP